MPKILFRTIATNIADTMRFKCAFSSSVVGRRAERHENQVARIRIQINSNTPGIPTAIALRKIELSIGGRSYESLKRDSLSDPAPTPAPSGRYGMISVTR